MAKDRDRRYQTPEHLVRDLLGGCRLDRAWRRRRPRSRPGRLRALGTRGSATSSGWCRSLRWSPWCSGLAWWGRELARPTSALAATSRFAAAAPLERRRRTPRALQLAGSSPGASERASSDDAASPAPVYSRNIPVSSNEDLLEIIATAPRRSVIVLSDDGPYQIGGRAWSFRAPAPLSNADLTIKAEAGVRPVLKFASDARLADRPPASLLHFVGGHVTIEGVAFELDVVLPDELVAAIRADGTELTLRGCSFRRTNSREGRNVAALSIRQTPSAGLCR